MLDREKYNIEREQALRDQVRELSGIFNHFIQNISDVRDRPIDNIPDDSVLEQIRNIPIQRKGRDPKEVGYELVHTIMDNTVTIKHPRFFFLCGRRNISIFLCRLCDFRSV